ncbi:hypothetical protein BT63DRAFT_478776 [Microthyrium microscopicum]|uniref:Uncharacterized protein n=1 Tax=Microthyrium microscopicum TaxID=703497 RepID=A0A6A6UG76_9PEZI|nr:hypothetical protein BT63DRAFT_478776 [Microthyrium microscopicum]
MSQNLARPADPVSLQEPQHSPIEAAQVSQNAQPGGNLVPNNAPADAASSAVITEHDPSKTDGKSQTQQADHQPVYKHILDVFKNCVLVVTLAITIWLAVTQRQATEYAQSANQLAQSANQLAQVANQNAHIANDLANNSLAVAETSKQIAKAALDTTNAQYLLSLINLCDQYPMSNQSFTSNHTTLHCSDLLQSPLPLLSSSSSAPLQSSTSVPNLTSPSEGHRLSSSAIAAISIGSVVGLAALAVLIYVYLMRVRRKGVESRRALSTPNKAEAKG